MSIQVGVYNVGGTTPLIADIPYSTLEWTHPLNKFGVASAIVDVCDPILLNVHPFTHEIRITDDAELAFAGPVRYLPTPLVSGGKMQIIAYDLAYWFAVRFVHQVLNYTGIPTPVSTIVNDIVQAALGPLDPNVLPYLNIIPCATTHERDVASIYDLTWQKHLTSIVGKLMNMSVHGRRINFWCINECLAELPPASADQFINFERLVRDGDTFTTHAAVFGATTPVPIIGDAGGPHPLWPVLVERSFDDDTYLDVASATSAAAALLTDRAKMTFGESEDFVARVDCDVPWKFTRLAPGMCTTMQTPYGDLRLLISEIKARVNEGRVTRTIGFKEL